jgi:hypothetical protein
MAERRLQPLDRRIDRRRTSHSAPRRNISAIRNALPPADAPPDEQCCCKELRPQD